MLLPCPGPGAGCRSPPHPLPQAAPGMADRSSWTGICTTPQQHQAATVLCSLGIFSFRDTSRKEAAADHQVVSEVDRAAKVSIASALWLLLYAPVIPIICTYLATCILVQ